MKVDFLKWGLGLFFLLIGAVISGVSGWLFFQPLPFFSAVQNGINLGFGLGFFVLGIIILRLAIEDIKERMS